MTTEPQNLKLDQIRIDGGTQPRACIDEQVVAEYAEFYKTDAKLPPVTVFFDGAAHWLADGFHRYWASKRIERDYVPADVHAGTQRDAILFSVGANADHGLRRTNGDKRKAVLTMLEDEEWSTWSAREIARRCRVSESCARRIKSDHTAHSAQYESAERTFIHPKTGKPATMKTGNIGRKRKSRPAKSPRIAKGAFRPAPHSADSAVPMRSVKLPLNNPEQAARSMGSLFDDEWMRRMATEALRILDTPKPLEGTEQ